MPKLGRRMMDETGGEEDVRGPVKRMLSDKYVHYKRVGEILAALSRYGFGKIWDSATLLRDLPLDTEARKDLMELKDSLRFRLLLESLGPTFIKLGQMLSTRPDLIPQEFVSELGNLRKAVPPFPFDEVKEIVEGELAREISEVFEEFEDRPLASASIGQVHRAVLRKGGEEVAVKVQRPGIRRMIKADIEILTDLATVLETTFSDIEDFDPRGVVEEFAHMINREMDYTIEARNIQRFRNNLADIEEVRVPEVMWDQSTRKILTMEFIHGVSMDEEEEISRMDIDRGRITKIFGEAYIQQVFMDGFFHADPHQGNLYLIDGDTVCFLDFGAIGYLDDNTKDLIGLFYMSLIRKDISRAAETLLQIAQVPAKEVDVQRLEWDLRDFLDYNFLRRRKVRMDDGMNQRIVTIALKHGFMLPSSFVLLERGLMQIEGVCRTLDPDFDIVEIAEDNLLGLVRERYRIDRDPIRHLETAHEYREFAKRFPRRADRVLKKFEDDEVTIKVDTSFLTDLTTHFRRSAIMLAISVVAAALVLYVAWAGQITGFGLVPSSMSVAVIVIIWLGLMWFVHRGD